MNASNTGVIRVVSTSNVYIDYVDCLTKLRSLSPLPTTQWRREGRGSTPPAIKSIYVICQVYRSQRDSLDSFYMTNQPLCLIKCLLLWLLFSVVVVVVMVLLYRHVTIVECCVYDFQIPVASVHVIYFRLNVYLFLYLISIFRLCFQFMII